MQGSLREERFGRPTGHSQFDPARQRGGLRLYYAPVVGSTQQIQLATRASRREIVGLSIWRASAARTLVVQTSRGCASDHRRHRDTNVAPVRLPDTGDPDLLLVHSVVARGDHGSSSSRCTPTRSPSAGMLMPSSSASRQSRIVGRPGTALLPILHAGLLGRINRSEAQQRADMRALRGQLGR